MKSKMETGKPELLKKINRQLVISHIVKEGQISRSQLAKDTGLALPSIMRITDALSLEGIIIDRGKGSSTGGRKPGLIEINPKYKYIFGIEIAIESTLVLTDFSGKMIDKWRSDQMPNLKPETLLQVILQELEKMKQRHGIEDHRIAGIGIGTPGSNFKHQTEIKRSILKGWEDIDIKAWFKERSQLPVTVDNIARTRTLSELWFGHGKDCKNFLYVFVDQGVGVGIVRRGEIEVGANGVAGEFGHTTIEMDGRPCYCGKSGCIEMYVSAGAITNQAEDLGLSTFAEVVARPHPKPQAQHVTKLLKEAGKYLACGLGNLINLYNPELVVLGGVVPLSSPELVDSVRAHLPSYIFNNNAAGTPVKLSAIDLSQTYLGSVALVINEALSKNII